MKMKTENVWILQKSIYNISIAWQIIGFRAFSCFSLRREMLAGYISGTPGLLHGEHWRSSQVCSCECSEAQGGRQPMAWAVGSLRWRQLMESGRLPMPDCQAGNTLNDLIPSWKFWWNWQIPVKCFRSIKLELHDEKIFYWQISAWPAISALLQRYILQDMCNIGPHFLHCTLVQYQIW